MRRIKSTIIEFLNLIFYHKLTVLLYHYYCLWRNRICKNTLPARVFTRIFNIGLFGGAVWDRAIRLPAVKAGVKAGGF